MPRAAIGESAGAFDRLRGQRGCGVEEKRMGGLPMGRSRRSNRDLSKSPMNSTMPAGKGGMRREPPSTQRGADRGSGLVPVSGGLCGKHTGRIVRRPMQSQLFLPTARQTNWLLLLVLLSLGEALYLRYLAIEYAQVSLACQAGLDTWLCATFRLVIVLFNYSAFGWVALGAALLNLLRPSILLVAVALAATAFGLVLHNANLAGVAAALLMLSLARPVPSA